MGLTARIVMAVGVVLGLMSVAVGEELVIGDGGEERLQLSGCL